MEKHIIIGKRIEKAMNLRGKTNVEVARAIGKNKSTLTRYIRGEVKNINIVILQAIAVYLNVSPMWIAGKNVPMENSRADIYTSDISPITTQKIPLLGDIACGFPIEASEKLDVYIETNSPIVADFCLRCKGDSMIGARIYDGDIVFIRKQDMVNNGEIAAVIIDNEATLKRVQYLPEENILILKAENPKYADLVYTGEKLDHIRILGKAVSFYSEIK